MRKWYRIYPTLLALSAAVTLASLPRLFGQAGGTTPVAKRASVKPLNLPDALPVATGYTVEDAFAINGSQGLNFIQPLSVVAPPGEKDRLFVVGKSGVIEVVTDIDGKNGGPKKSVFMDINPYLQAKGWKLGQPVEWGIMGIAFHPNFKNNGYFYITYDFITPDNRRGQGFDRVSRFTVSKTDPNKPDMTTELPLITQLDPASNHNGGCIIFGQDGYLYTSIGDGGNADDSFDNARWIDKDFFAAIYRIDVDRKPENIEPNPHTQNNPTIPSAIGMTDGHANYKVPKDNPFIGITKYFGRDVDPKKVRTEIYAAGLRNAWRFSIDEPTGRMFCAEIGQNIWEEIDIIVKGGNYGWSYKEAFHDGPANRRPAPPEAKLIDPIYEYGHGNRSGQFSGNSISGGIVYRGSRLTELNGKYIFADYTSRRVWSLTEEKDGKWTPALLATLPGNTSTMGIVEIAADPRNGDILLCNLPAPVIDGMQANGKILRLVRAGVQGNPPPSQLSQVGAFKDLKTLEPADGVVPFEPNVTFWSDYAIKQRWFTIPQGSATIGFNATGNWTFPAGTVWVKHFEMEMTRGDKSTRRRLETRFIVNGPSGMYGITYKWRPDGSDADLVPEAGMDETLTIKDGNATKLQTWHYPSQSECMSCHTSVAGGALGFNTFQLNGNGAGKENQIAMLQRIGYFSPETAPPTPSTLPAYAKADDAKAPLEWRVRSYLGANCVQCHQPGGIVQGLWDARPTTPLANAGIINGELISDKGDKTGKVIVPGDVAHSALFKRVEGKTEPRMPQIATN
ncbi:MAG TPA: PQQ-dependent sugar dehydrogenase, partial [Phycisphaerae bacterium]|nr:PQQ-dependent sugar dehydrogenase [Phycisphaerae bacterium]